MSSGWPFENVTYALPSEPRDNVSLVSPDDEVFRKVGVYFFSILRNYQVDQLGHVFASPQNVYTLHKFMDAAFYKRFQIRLPVQEPWKMASFMASAWYTSTSEYSKNNLEDDLQKLNNSVLHEMVKEIMSAFEQLYSYLPQIDRVPTPLPHAHLASQKGVDGRSVHLWTQSRFLNCRPSQRQATPVTYETTYADSGVSAPYVAPLYAEPMHSPCTRGMDNRVIRPPFAPMAPPQPLHNHLTRYANIDPNVLVSEINPAVSSNAGAAMNAAM